MAEERKNEILELLPAQRQLLDILLKDRTTGRNIIWATKDYAALGPEYEAAAPILPEIIAEMEDFGFRTRASKAQEARHSRTREKAEVFTPAWICNAQNNLVDTEWFGRTNVFNTPSDKSWTPATGPIEFPQAKHRGWRDYVDARRMEIACGEAPYLVSRYDAVTGEPLPLEARIGLLDRKLRVVGENAENEEDWLIWARRAFQSIYAYEYQGDNLLLARFNLFMTYLEYAAHRLGRLPSFLEQRRIATVISWNLWQMDALTYGPPLRDMQSEVLEKSLFAFDGEDGIFVENPAESPCRIKDWRAKKIREYYSLVKGER